MNLAKMFQDKMKNKLTSVLEPLVENCGKKMSPAIAVTLAADTSTL